MDTSSELSALQEAARLRARVRRSGRWYVHYLVIYAGISLVMSTLFGVLGSRLAVALLTPLWVAFVALMSGWAGKQRAAMRGFTRLHLTVMLGWTAAWLVTVLVGTHYYPHTLWWWAFGGLLTAIAPLLGARSAYRRTA